MIKLKSLLKGEKGFTLIELMVVVLIIAILIAIAVPVFNVARERTRLRACQATQRTVVGALETYMASYEAYPVAVGDLVPQFMKAVPTLCPSGGTYVYTPGVFDSEGNLTTAANFTCPLHPPQ